MTKDVLIAIRGTQHTEGEEPQVIELTTDGQLTAEDGVYSVSYRESEMTGLEGVVTTFRVENDRVILDRVGELNSTMTFIQGRKTESLYDLGFGAMLLGVQAKTVRADLGEKGGSLFVDYAVEIEHVPVGTNTYEITVWEP